MTYLTQRLVAGVALASVATASFSTSAFAQVAPHAQQSPQQAATSASGQASATTSDDGISALDQEVVVQGDPEDIRHRVSVPLPARAMVMDENHTKITRRAWLAHGWTNEQFDQARNQTVNLCTRIAYFTDAFGNLADRYAATQPRIAELAGRYHRMSRNIHRAGFLRTLGNIAEVGLAFTVNPVYGAMVGATAIGGEATGRSSTHQQILANDAGSLNNELTGMHVEFNLMSIELYEDYLNTMGNWCGSNRTIASYTNAYGATTHAASYGPAVQPAADHHRSEQK